MNFPVHEIRVTKVAYDDPAGTLGIAPSRLKYRIDHGNCTKRGEECLVEDTVNNIGLHAALFGIFDRAHRIAVGNYFVRGWATKYDRPDEPIEYDSGIEMVPSARV